MTLNTPPRRLPSGLKTMTSKCLSCLPNLLTLTLLSTFGCISKGLCRSIQHHPRGCMSYGIEWRWNGMRLQQKHAKTSYKVCLEELEQLLELMGVIQSTNCIPT